MTPRTSLEAKRPLPYGRGSVVVFGKFRLANSAWYFRAALFHLRQPSSPRLRRNRLRRIHSGVGDPSLRSGLCCSFCEIQAGEITVIFSSGLVVGVGGFDFVGEVAEVVFFVVAMYLGGPFFLSFVPVYAFVF